MAWTEITRPQYRREGLRYASSLTDAEWILIEPFMPPVSPIGRPRETDFRKVVDAILYLASTGCQWRQLPKEFPPYSTVQGYFYGWSRDGTFAAINQFLVAAAREQAGRTANPGVIDSQSVKTTESGGPRGFDAAKKVKGRKRHIVSPTRLACCWRHRFIRPMCRTATAPCRCSNRCAARSRSCGVYRGDQLIRAIEDCGP